MHARTRGLVVLTGALLLAACQTVKVPTTCDQGALHASCLGNISVSESKVSLLVDAVEKTIAAINNPAFEAQIESFRQDLAAGEPYSAACPSRAQTSTASLVLQLRDSLPLTSVSTYGRVKGWLLYVFAGNLAFEGAAKGPVRLNRWGLGRSSPSVAIA